MPQNSVSGLRARRIGAVVAATALASVGIPATALGQETSGSDSSVPTQTGNSSVDGLIGLIPDEIVIGNPGVGAGSEGLRDLGSGIVPDTALSVGQVLGSVAPLEALGSAGGSAAASVASSGSLPGSVYVNPTGSLGSGTIGLGSLSIPEYLFPVLSVQLAGGYFAAMAERQEAGELYPHELSFWHDVVLGSAEAGGVLEDAAAEAGTELPGGLAGSIDAVQRSALQDPVEENERRRAIAEAAAEAEATDGGQATDQAGDGDEAVADDEAVAEGLTDGREPAAGMPPLTDAAVMAEPTIHHHAAGVARVSGDQAPGAGPQAEGPATLAATGAETTAIAGLATVSLLVGALLLAGSRRRG
ncbi:hypothetical protein CEY15_01885 [Dietzia natronolimnaea]|uniref:Gram-positive cocci surface proteins LPxTG domain-containing protein n=1 Tax=Dietzia natronolimnaea TaxID=161920 RepID=A0A2A2WTT0_9ACTN|nr:hypothetical protein [Dietzia natronolimnaea]PAY24578.1 hypothetical protein CEY15_01885 [Dietzia natronolimnaea]